MKIIHGEEFYWFENDWRKERKKGPFRYILFENGLLWGTLLSVVLTTWFYLDEHGWNWPLMNVQEWLWKWLLYFLVFTIGGALIAAIKWFINEKRLKKYDHPNTEQKS